MKWSKNPGDAVKNQSNCGTMEFTPGERPPPTVTGTLVRIVLSALLLGLYVWAVNEFVEPRTTKEWAYYGWGLFVYCFFAFFIRPKPGSFFGGVMYRGHFQIDNPYTNTDDINRMLLALTVFFLPGVVIAESIIDPFRLLLCIMFPAWYKTDRTGAKR